MTAYSVPFPTPVKALKRVGSNISGLSAAQRAIVLYSSLNDTISNTVAAGCGTTTHACRLNSNVNELECNNGSGFLSLSNPHDRQKYQACAGGLAW